MLHSLFSFRNMFYFIFVRTIFGTVPFKISCYHFIIKLLVRRWYCKQEVSKQQQSISLTRVSSIRSSASLVLHCSNNEIVYCYFWTKGSDASLKPCFTVFNIQAAISHAKLQHFANYVSYENCPPAKIHFRGCVESSLRIG